MSKAKVIASVVHIPYSPGYMFASGEPAHDVLRWGEVRGARHLVYADSVPAGIATAALQVPAAADAGAAPDWDALRHSANEWADMATNGLQWMRNVVDGTSDPKDALANLERNLAHCRAVNDAPSVQSAVRVAAAPQAPAAPTIQAVAWRYSIGIGKWAATTDEASAWSASFDRRVDALGIIETLSAPGTPAPAAAVAPAAGAAPTDAEIEAFREAFDWEGYTDPRAAQRAFGRAVLARWGAAAPAEEAEDGWMPIETAPKDGTEIDLFNRGGHREAGAFWGLPPHECGEMGRYCDSDWHGYEPGWVTDFWGEPQPDSTFSHWRRKPAPPAARARQEGQA